MMRAATLFNFLIEAMLTGSVMILLLLVVRRLLRRDAAHHDRLLGRQYKYVFRHGRSDPCAGDHSCAGGNSGP